MKINTFNKPFTNEYLENYLVNLGKQTIEFINSVKINRLDNKLDGTVLSQADIELDKILFKSLKLLDPTIPIISEERSVKKEVFMKKVYWLIDPIDGTSNYINGGQEFTINVALIQDGIPVIGLIAHPPTKKIWLALNDKTYIYITNNKLRTKLFSKPIDQSCPKIIISKEKNFYTDSFINKIEKKEIIYVSSSLKFCCLAEKKAILYPRFSRIKKWDIAAGHAILKSSGGDLVNMDGTEYKYNYPSELSRKFFAFSLKNWRKLLKLPDNF